MPINGKYTLSEKERVRTAITYLQQHYTQNISADHLSEEVRLDKKILQEVIQIITGLTIHKYLMKLRIDKASADLTDFHQTIESIARKHGFASASHFSMEFKRQQGIQPKEYRIRLSSDNGNSL